MSGEPMDYRAAIDDLVFRFQCADAAIGFRAQNVGDGKSAAVFDDLASHEMHMSKRTPMHRSAVQRIRRVDACLSTLEPSQVSSLRRAFVPQGGLPGKLTSALSVPCGFHRVPIVGWVLESHAFRVAYASAFKTLVPAPKDRAIRWLADANIETLRRLATDALEELSPALSAYEAARKEHNIREAEDRERRRELARAYTDEQIAMVHARETERFNRRLYGLPKPA